MENKSLRNFRKNERGQALPLFVLGIVVLMGFAALAIDGGMLLADRRHAQNTADTSAMSGALLIAQSYVDDVDSSVITEATTFAEERAASNDFDDNGTTNEVDIAVTGPFKDNGIYYLFTVSIWSEVESTFSHLIYGGPLQNTVSATVRVRPIQNLAHGYAMFGASKDECKTMWFMGTADTVIQGGGVFSNSSADSKNCESAVQNGAGSLITTGGDNEAVGSFDYNPGQVSPAPIEGADQQELPPIPIPDCSGLPNHGSPKLKDSVTLSPGIYDDISNSNAIVILEPGLYCITGSKGFQSTGGQIVGSGVTIYMEDGDFDVSGNTYVDISAPANLVDASGNQWAGMLLYMDPNNASEIHVSGSANSIYTGTIYAPDPASPSSKTKCTFTGNDDSLGLLSTQIICYTVKITGTAQIDISHDKTMVYIIPPTLDLSE